MKDVAMSKKQVFLAALGERFPAWQAPEPAPVKPDGEPAQPLPETPQALLERLLQAVPTLSPEVKEEFAKKLQQAGLAPKQAVDFSIDIPGEYRKKLNLPEGKPLNPERTIKLLSALFEMTLAMDQLVWALWKQIAPQSNIRREGDFGKLAGPYLVGDTEVSTQQLAQILERTRRLNASLLGATGRGSSNYAQKYVDQFAPDVIEDLARIEKSTFATLESVSWKKYVQLAKEHLSKPVIENEIQKAIAKAAERLMMGGSIN
jgi:hypothetical protein